MPFAQNILFRKLVYWERKGNFKSPSLNIVKSNYITMSEYIYYVVVYDSRARLTRLIALTDPDNVLLDKTH